MDDKKFKKIKKIVKSDYEEAMDDVDTFLDDESYNDIKIILKDQNKFPICVKLFGAYNKFEEVQFDKLSQDEQHIWKAMSKKHSNMFENVRIKTRLQFNEKEVEYKKIYPQKELVYENQRKCAHKILHEFNENNKKAVTLIALPQVGKTGAFLYTAIQAILNEDDEKIFLPENIFIFSGLSDKAWLEQTRNDMTDELKNNVFHLNTLSRMENIIKDKHNSRILFIIDECHIATSQDQTISKIFTKLDETSHDYNNVIYFLNVSATPSAIAYDMDKLKNSHTTIFLDPPQTYVGFHTFFEENRIYNMVGDKKGEYITDNFLDILKNIIEARYKLPKYHIFRMSIHRSNERKRFDKFAETNNWTILEHDSLTQFDKQTYIDIDRLLSIAPNKHIFIIIKNFWRAGKRINDSHIGCIYEYTQAINFDVTAQGLVARFCGNDKQQLPKLDTPCFFCNTDTLEKYLEFISKECNLSKANYIANKFETRNGFLRHVVPTCYESIDAVKNGISNLFNKSDYLDLPYDIPLDDDIYAFFEKNNEMAVPSKQRKTEMLKNIEKYNSELYNKIKDFSCEVIFIAGIRDGHNSELEANKSYMRNIIKLREYIDAGRYVMPHPIKNQKNKKYNNLYTCHIDNRSKSKKVLITVYYGQKYKELENNAMKDLSLVNDFC